MATSTSAPSAGFYELVPHPASVPEARRLAVAAAPAYMTDEQRSKLELAVTEVVANAVRHSGSDAAIRLILTAKDDHFCVRVIDGGAGLVPRPGAMGSEPGAGFGLFLLEQVTKRWGMTREAGCTRVWFELDYMPNGKPITGLGSCLAAEA